MSSRRKVFWAIAAVFALGLGGQAVAQPIFENRTPVGFSPSDSTTTTTFVTDTDVTVLVDLNEAANATNPIIANFQKIEQAVPFFTNASTAGYMSQAIEIDDQGVLHRAWVQRRGGISTLVTSTPLYGVVYSKSLNGGLSFSDTVSVSGTLRFDMITPNVALTGGFSTVDLVVNSKGNPRVVYAFDNSPDGKVGVGNAQTEAFGGTPALREFNNIFFNYSNDGGSTWLPSNAAVTINDVVTADPANEVGKKCAFPRMDITSTDDIFIVYQRDLGGDVNGSHDIMLAKVDEDSLKSGSAQAVRVGPVGNVGSRGGVRIAPDAAGQETVSPDIAVGDDDVLHVVWYHPDDDAIAHKTLPAEDWTDVSSFGWNQNVIGAPVGTFTSTAANSGLDVINLATTANGRMQNAILQVHLFPTVVVDKARTPDRVYVVWKHTDATGIAGSATIANDENIAYNIFNYDGSIGGNASWESTLFAFPTGANGAVFQPAGGGLFQNSSRYQIESFWGYTDRVAAVVDDRIPNDSGDLHVVFSGGGSQVAGTLTTGVNAIQSGQAENLYYSRLDATSGEWELPQVVASARHTIASGVGSEVHDGGVQAQHRALFSPDLSMLSGDPNLYMAFVGGSPSATGTEIRGRSQRISTADVQQMAGRGFSTIKQGDIQPLPYFKVIGRSISFDDVSVPLGGFQYQMTYNPLNPQTLAGKNLVTVTAGDQTDGSGLGADTPGTGNAPGGFLTGQWRAISGFTLGVTSLSPGTAGAIFKGAISQSQATNDNGIWEGKVDDDGSRGFAEWGDDGDKVGLLIKLNVLASDSGLNMFVIGASTSAVTSNAGGLLAATGGPSQSIVIDTTVAAGAIVAVTPFLKDITGPVAASGVTAPMGSYFWMGANIGIQAANDAPVVDVSQPNASTSGFANSSFEIRYTLFDGDNSVNAANTDLQAELYYYPDNGLNSVLDIRTFATLIVDEQDDATVTAAPASGNGTGDFVESTGATNVQIYTWDDPGQTLQALGFAPITKALDGTYFIYIVADDQVNPPVFDVSAGSVRVRPIPIINSLAPVATDTADTGEFSNLSKTNPYKIKFDVDDFDDNAQIRLFASLTSGLNASNVTLTGTFPALTLALAGGTVIQLSDTLRTDEDTEFDFDVTAQGAAGDSIITQGSYFLYVVVADDDSFAVAQSSLPLSIRHSPAFEFTNPLVGELDKINTTQQFNYAFEWQRGRSDQDLDGNAIISLYYIGTDPQDIQFSGTDSTALIDSGAVLIAGSIREDDEGGGDQFIWDFRNPPSELPNTMRSTPTGAAAELHDNPHVVQVGEVDDTVWVYAVLHDSLGNTTVAGGGAVLLLGSAETPASQAPKVTMLTPPSGGLDLTNGDVVRLEWDAFLIDDGTGTDDAYLRLYAAPAGKYSSITELESHNVADVPPPR